MIERLAAPLCMIVAVALVAGGAGGGLADDERGERKRRDHEIARKALLSGEIRPLEAVIAEVRRTVPGDIVGVELETHHGRWIYKLKVITPSGTMQRVTVDGRQAGDAAPAGGAALPGAADTPERRAPKAP